MKGDDRVTISDDMLNMFFQSTTDQPSSFHLPVERIVDTVSLVACISYKSPSTLVSSCSTKTPTGPKTTRRRHPRQATINFDTGFAHHRRDLTTMYIATTIPKFPRLRGFRGLDAFFHDWKLATISCYKSHCLYCPIVLAVRWVFGGGQITKEDSNFAGLRLSINISISLQGLGPSLKQTHFRNTTTVSTSTCTPQACSSPRCSP